jgi:hypothetical protein
VATASQAIDRIAEETGIMQATVFRAARFLREHDSSLWPQGSQGRGQEAHVEAGHLVNVVLALAAADPLTGAPEVVTELRGMVPAQDNSSAPGLPGATFGEALDQHVSRLAGSEGRGRDAQDWCTITVFNGPQFHARVYCPQHPLDYYIPRRSKKGQICATACCSERQP